MRALLVTLGCALAALMLPTAALATPLSIETVEYGPWSNSVATLQRDLASDGATVHVVVLEDGDQRLACADYTLTPDAVTSAAFSIGGCEPVTGATTLRLLRRDALFVEDTPVWRPATAGLAAVQIRRVEAAGRAPDEAHGEVACNLTVRPYVADLHDGHRVYLTPERYALRLHRADVTVTDGPDGWALHAHDAGQIALTYEITDRRDGRVVLRENATLTCTRDAAEASPVVRPPPVIEAPAEGPAVQYHFDVYAFHLSSNDLSSTSQVNYFGSPLPGRFSPGIAYTYDIALLAAHIGVGVEVPHAAFSLEGGFLPLGWTTGYSNGYGAQAGFLRAMGGPRIAGESFGLTVGPNVDLWWLAAEGGTPWTTNTLVLAGLTAELRLYTYAGHGDNGLPGATRVDFFARATYDFIGGDAWMVSLGIGFGNVARR